MAALEVTLSGWAATIGLIVGLFALDLFVSRPGHAHVIGFREATVARACLVYLSTGLSLILASLVKARRDPELRAHAGSLRDREEQTPERPRP
jgi:hypothetical protein